MTTSTREILELHRNIEAIFIAIAENENYFYFIDELNVVWDRYHRSTLMSEFKMVNKDFKKLLKAEALQQKINQLLTNLKN